jgi:hypothetical protein
MIPNLTLLQAFQDPIEIINLLTRIAFSEVLWVQTRTKSTEKPSKNMKKKKVKVC